MTSSEAADTLRLLARGLDPATKQPLPEDSPCHRSAVIRAFFLAVEALDPSSRPSPKKAASNKTKSPKTSDSPRRTGESWEPWEEAMLKRLYAKSELRLETIAKKHGRTKSAIKSRAKKLGLEKTSDSASDLDRDAPERHGNQWKPWEEDRVWHLCTKERLSIEEIARRHKRTTGAIAARLIRLHRGSTSVVPSQRDDSERNLSRDGMPWPDWEDRMLRRFCKGKGCSMDYLMERHDRNKEEILARIRELQLVLPTEEEAKTQSAKK